MTAVWPPERVEQLKALLDQGKTSGEIGIIMGVGRGGICGKVGRLGLKFQSGEVNGERAARAARVKVSASRARRLPPPAAAPPPAPPVACVINPAMKTWATIEVGECRYPCGDDAYCGRPALHRKPYCAEHDALCHHTTGSLKELERSIRRYA
jgi:hypothetical protein